MRRWARARVLAVALAATSNRAAATTSDQLRPELRLYLAFNERTRLLLRTQVTLAPGAGYVAGLVEGDVQVQVAPLREKLFPTVQVSRRERATLAAGYRYAGTLAEGDFKAFQENRLLAEVTTRLLLPGEVLASDRNRFEGRRIDGDWSWRYRNKFELVRGFDLGSVRAGPLASVEVFFDSRYDAWTRLRIEAGADVEDLVAPKTVLEVYYLRQYDSRSQPSLINGVGVIFEVFR